MLQKRKRMRRLEGNYRVYGSQMRVVSGSELLQSTIVSFDGLLGRMRAVSRYADANPFVPG